jgi:hypothetical protein
MRKTCQNFKKHAHVFGKRHKNMGIEVAKNVPCGCHLASTSLLWGRAVPRGNFFARPLNDVSSDVVPPNSDVEARKSDMAPRNADVACPVSIISPHLSLTVVFILTSHLTCSCFTKHSLQRYCVLCNVRANNIVFVLTCWLPLSPWFWTSFKTLQRLIGRYTCLSTCSLWNYMWRLHVAHNTCKNATVFCATLL